MKAIWQKFSRRERGLVALTALVLLAFAAKYAVITPFLQRRESVQRQLESQPQLLTKNLRYVGQKEAMLAALDAARMETKAQEPKLLTGDTPSVSASDLQETVQALASREGTGHYHSGAQSRAGWIIFKNRHPNGDRRPNSASRQPYQRY